MGDHGAYLEALVLQHPLDGSIFTGGRQLGLEDDTEGTISDNLALCVLHISSLARDAILDLFANNLYFAGVSGWSRK